MKQCNDCLAWKLPEDFYAHPYTADRLLARCKTCHRRRVRENRRAKLAYYSDYEKIRNRDPQRRANKQDYERTYRIRNPEKAVARNAVNNAVRDGRIVKPDYCTVCGRTNATLQAHHDDYAKPLDVLWLCFVCHREHGHGQVVIDKDYGTNQGRADGQS